jgi:hypothetical protein
VAVIGRRPLGIMKFLAILVALAFLVSGEAAERVSKTDTMYSAARRALPMSVDDAQIAAALEKGLKHPTGSAIAMAIAADVSQVETANFGVWGRKRSEYDRYETTPVEWLSREDGLLQVVMRTRAWREGQRYTMNHPLLIKTDGTVLFR